MNPLLPVIISALLGGLLGGGGVARLLVAALENRMRDTFASRTDFNGLGDRLTGVTTIAHAANDTASAAHSKVLELEKFNDLRLDHVDGRWKEAIEKFEAASRRMEKILERLAVLETRVNK